MNNEEKETMTAILCQNEKLKKQLTKALEDNAKLYAKANIQKDLARWSEETFPNQSVKAKFDHLKDEIKELGEDFLCNLAARAGVDLLDESLIKLAINKTRTWGEPDERGVCHHIANEKCIWDTAWVGGCENLAIKNGCCEEHQKVCCSCGEPATHSCDYAAQFVCGFPLCDKCIHVNGGHSRKAKEA